MRLSPEARGIFLEAAREAFTRRLTAEEVFDEVVRVVREARTPEEVDAAGRLVGRVKALSRMITEAAAPEPEPPAPPEPNPVDGAGAAEAVPESDQPDAVSEEAA